MNLRTCIILSLTFASAGGACNGGEPGPGPDTSAGTPDAAASDVGPAGADAVSIDAFTADAADTSDDAEPSPDVSSTDAAALDAGDGGLPPVPSLPPGSPVVLGPRASDGTLSGTFTATLTGDEVTFWVRATGPTSAAAHYEFPGLEVDITVTDRATATLAVYSIEFDGRGALSENDFAILNVLFTYPITHAIRQVPLELGCVAGFAPAEIAALVFPWQMVLKYLVPDRPPDVLAAVEQASCVYLPEVPAVMTPPKPPREGLLPLGNDDLLPAVPGFFAFDEAGAARMFRLQDSPRGPCQSTCRGACGPDCEPTNCRTTTSFPICEKDQNNDNTGRSYQRVEYDCGVHQGCIAHDECYDRCNSIHGCGSFSAALCMHDALDDSSCDRIACDTWGYGICTDWAQGGGPFERRQTFRYYTPMTPDGNCPPPHTCVPAGTLVWLADGSQAPIETLDVSESIRTIDPSAGAAALADIEATYAHAAGPYWLDRLIVSGGAELELTPEHPVWTVSHGWVAAADLVPGDRLLAIDASTGVAGEVTLVSIISAASQTDVVYNLKTSRSSYVAEGVLVHNKCVGAESLIDTPLGPRRARDVRPGDVVLGEADGRPAPAVVRRVFEKRTVLGRLPAKQLGPSLVVTINHPIATVLGATEAGRLSAADTEAIGTVYDFETSTGNYASEGVLLLAEP